MVGTAFDYIARWIIARTVNTEKETSYLDLIAEKGAQCCEFIALRNKTESILKRYGDEIKNVECFVNGVDNKEKIIRTAIFLQN